MQQQPPIKFRINLSSGEIYLQPSEVKVNLCDFSTKLACRLEQKELAENKLLIIGEGLKDVVRCVSSTRGRPYDIACLKLNKEEAETRLLPYARYAATAETKIVFDSPDTKVLY